jgi:hypothetical protein
MLATATFASTTPTMSSSTTNIPRSTVDHLDNDDEQQQQQHTSSTNNNNKGVAGRINYAEWDKVASHLVESLEHEDEQEKQEEAAKVRTECR